jgi:hypothetical protein
MAVEKVEKRPKGSVTLHGYVGDYGITLHLNKDEYETLVYITNNSEERP